MAALTRRDLILSSLGAAIAAAGSAGFPATLYAAGEVTVDAFLSLSEQLTEVKDLDRDVATTILGGLLATGHGPALATLVKEEADFASHTDLANAIVAAWYSGVYDSGSGQAVATFTEALVWNALAFSKPWAECGGETGYWADAPEG